MNKNLEELKRRIEIRDKVGYINEESIVEMLYNSIPILEDFEKRLDKLERKEEGFGPRIRLIPKPIKKRSRHKAQNKKTKTQTEN